VQTLFSSQEDASNKEKAFQLIVCCIYITGPKQLLSAIVLAHSAQANLGWLV